MFCFKGFSKRTLAVTLLLVGADNLGWQIYFFIGFFRHGARSINTKVFIGITILLACTQTFPGIRE